MHMLPFPLSVIWNLFNKLFVSNHIFFPLLHSQVLNNCFFQNGNGFVIVCSFFFLNKNNKCSPQYIQKIL